VFPQDHCKTARWSVAQDRRSSFLENTFHFLAQLRQNSPILILFDIHNLSSNSVSRKLFLNKLLGESFRTFTVFLLYISFTYSVCLYVFVCLCMGHVA